MQAIILADGDVGPRHLIDEAWPGWARADALVVAADGGARHAGPLGLRIDRWVGDGDSIGEAGLAALASTGVPIERSPTDKDESDTELATLAALRLGATELAILGALGGPRIDHTLANLSLLALPELAGRETFLIASDARIRLLRVTDDAAPSRALLVGRAGDVVSLFPVGGDVEGITTDGLRYPLRDEPLVVGRTRGLSNVRDVPEASVTVRRGRLLIVETPATLMP
jgi:thiamine pyrophosphokinase